MFGTGSTDTMARISARIAMSWCALTFMEHTFLAPTLVASVRNERTLQVGLQGPSGFDRLDWTYHPALVGYTGLRPPDTARRIAIKTTAPIKATTMLPMRPALLPGMRKLKISPPMKAPTIPTMMSPRPP